MIRITTKWKKGHIYEYIISGHAMFNEENPEGAIICAYTSALGDMATRGLKEHYKKAFKFEEASGYIKGTLLKDADDYCDGITQSMWESAIALQRQYPKDVQTILQLMK